MTLLTPISLETDEAAFLFLFLPSSLPSSLVFHTNPPPCDEPPFLAAMSQTSRNFYPICTGWRLKGMVVFLSSVMSVSVCLQILVSKVEGTLIIGSEDNIGERAIMCIAPNKSTPDSLLSGHSLSAFVNSPHPSPTYSVHVYVSPGFVHGCHYLSLLR